MSDPSSHWNQVYERRAPTDVSWFQAEAKASLEFFAATGASVDSPVIDVGAGASRLVDGLLARGYRDITLLDVAESAFVETRRRLGSGVAESVRYIVSDVTAWTPARSFTVWHDRAVFHFLIEPSARSAYVRALSAALSPGAHAIIATFAPEGPERCSGLAVRRYSADALAAEFAPVLTRVEARAELHVTPQGVPQAFTMVRFVRAGSAS